MIFIQHFTVSRLVFLCTLSPLAWAQTQTTPVTPPDSADHSDSGIHNTDPIPPPTEDKHIFGVLPNYRTAEESQVYKPLTAKQKFTIAEKDTLDGPGFVLAGLFAGLYQWEDQNPSFGQGIKGYAHRYVTAYGDQAIGNMMTEAIMPTILHEDPRYFRRGTGSVKSRTWYALSRVLVTRTDSGGTRFNFSEFLGNGVDGAIGNAYYPDDRGFGQTVERTGLSIGTDAISDVLKEFWPDFKKHVLHKQTVD